MPHGVQAGVSGDEVLHAPRQVGLRRTEEEVEVVGHEHETEQVPTELPDRLLQSLEQPLIVTLVLEHGSPELATGHHVWIAPGYSIRNDLAMAQYYHPGLVPKTGNRT